MTRIYRRGQAVADLTALLHPVDGPLAVVTSEVDGMSAIQLRDWFEGMARDPFGGEPFDEVTAIPARVLRDGGTEGAPDLSVFAMNLAASLAAWRDEVGLAELWSTVWAEVALQSRPVRAAFFNGMREAAEGLVPADQPVSEAECVSQPREEVCAKLCALARAAGPEDRKAVAMADYGNDWEQHLSRLNDVIDAQACVIAKRDNWFPLETVQLKSHCPGEQGHVPALAVLLVTSICNGDIHGDIEFRWQRQAAEWRALPGGERCAIMNGVRHVYESLPDWEPDVRPVGTFVIDAPDLS
ncbi:hypothetical protein [Roseovarius indicus]|uniref:Uncharacterized protein n=1 Tax=Roseovarius indicus TaxID=540747 RepID=A0A0T5PF23_9RHOB|nr:hypothetical protein [Roseovarius indicus]KRS19815.1 hypothetical protein XM52_03025 [Roseovarius indicus]QEW28821.1 hypothetical protein RIdsm_04661 [Roseovarius indicus]SFD83905.1 hypothetical protein SAMN04488031_102841 [Roseovarius indicus]